MFMQEVGYQHKDDDVNIINNQKMKKKKEKRKKGFYCFDGG